VAKKKPKDQHKSGFMVRLPESHRPPLDALKKKHRRATTTEVQIALERHYQAEGVPPPGST
jgi:hypothetical protein